MRARILAIFLILLLGLGSIAAKLFTIQIQHGDRLTERATQQYQRLVPLVSRRGTISDRAGRELAVSLRVSSVFAQPGAIADPRATARALAPILGQPAREIQARLTTDKTVRLAAAATGAAAGGGDQRPRPQGHRPVPGKPPLLSPPGAGRPRPGDGGARRPRAGGGRAPLRRPPRGEAAVRGCAAGRPGTAGLPPGGAGAENPHLRRPPDHRRGAPVHHRARAGAGRGALAGPRRGRRSFWIPTSGEILALANQPTFDPNQYKTGQQRRQAQPRGRRLLRARVDLQGDPGGRRHGGGGRSARPTSSTARTGPSR